MAELNDERSAVVEHRVRIDLLNPIAQPYAQSIAMTPHLR